MEIYLSNEKRAPGCSGYIGDEILPSYVVIIINHNNKPLLYKDPGSLLNNQDSMESKVACFRGSFVSYQ